MKNAVIIVAAGKGSRFGSSTPKQFLTLINKPVYIHSIDRFLSFSPSIQIVLVLPSATSTIDIEKIKEEIHIHTQRHVTTVLGGKSRFESVKNGLMAIDEDAKIVAIHDAVRPLVATEVIKSCFEEAQKSGNAIPTIPLVNSIREISGDDSTAVERNNYKLVQTPQCFAKSQVINAYKQCFSDTFTDDASVVEAAGYKIKMVEGNRENIKITTPPDFLYAELLLKSGF